MNCDYKFIIPDGYVYLGTKNGYLTKESEQTYKYSGDCSTNKNDIIRFSPKQAYWKADMKYSLEYAPKFSSNVIFNFPRLYRGAKLQNVYYEISSLEHEILNEDELIFEDINLKVPVPGENKEKVGVKLETGFLNELGDEFKVYFPESYYEIDLSNVDQTIIDKANEIIRSDEYSGKPNYYKIGKFVNSYITYNLTYFGSGITINEIYTARKGVCEHFTLLYNAMLNAIGIKTVYISGWAFSNAEISGNKDTVGHAWTAALIDNKWIELDATWGLFEGIPAGHIFKNFFNERYSYSTSTSLTSSSPIFERDPNIYMITDNEELQKLKNLHNENNNNDNNNNNGKNKDSNGQSENESCYINIYSILMVCLGLFSIF